MSRTLQIVSTTAVVTGLLLFWSGTGLVMSWAGHRPLSPDANHPFAYNNHGIMYVSGEDLVWSRLLTFGGIALFVVGFIVARVGRARAAKKE